jgi:putative ABC transport system ATP-binding protein
MDTVCLKNVVKQYEEGGFTVRAVDGIDLTIRTGEFAAIAGPSGSGKTTLLNLIGGLDRPDTGEVIIDGIAAQEKSDAELTELRRQKIGFIFQAYNLIPVLTAFENVQFMLHIQGVPEGDHQEKILALFKRLGLENLENRFPPQLSGGQQQRVAVARALVGSPAIILADEPTANLDSETSRNLLALMAELNRERGITFLFSSHDAMVIAMARRVIGLRDGKIRSDEQKTA